MDAMATHPSASVEEQVEETQQATLAQDDQLRPNYDFSQIENNPSAEPTMFETRPKRGRPNPSRSSANRRVRSRIGSLVALEIADDLKLHAFVVQRVLDTLEKVAVKHLADRGVFHTNLFTAKLRARNARQAGEQQRVYGNGIAVKGKPEKRTLKLQPTKILKQKCA